MWQITTLYWVIYVFLKLNDYVVNARVISISHYDGDGQVETLGLG